MIKRNKSILTDNMERCFFCGRPKEHIHEVFYGTDNRQKSIQWGCYIPLCLAHHTGSKNSVHRNHALDMQLKQITQTKFEEMYGHDKFMEVFHKSYL